LGEQIKIMIFGNKRGEIEIIAQILLSTKNKVKKTHILYNTNISYSNFIKYFDFLIKKEFIEEKDDNPGGKIYQITEKGEHLLESINKLFKNLQ
jgi:predicted transcriptional regulator